MQIDNELIDRLYSLIITKGGFTFNTRNQTELTGPYWVVSLQDQEQRLNANTSPNNIKELLRIYLEVKEPLLISPDNYLGAWLDKGTLYLDISEAYRQSYETLETVKQIARDRGQLAIYDMIFNRSIPV